MSLSKSSVDGVDGAEIVVAEREKAEGRTTGMIAAGVSASVSEDSPGLMSAEMEWCSRVTLDRCAA